MLFSKKDFKKFTVFQPKHKLKIQVNFFVDTRDAHLTYIVISYNFSLKSEISSMIHTKALYWKCAGYIACSKIKDFSLEIKTSLCFFSDPVFIRLYKTVLLIYSVVRGCSSCFTKGDLDLSTGLSTSLIRMSAGTVLFLN